MAGDEPSRQGSRTQEKPDAGQGSRWAGKKTDCADNAITLNLIKILLRLEHAAVRCNNICRKCVPPRLR